MIDRSPRYKRQIARGGGGGGVDKIIWFPRWREEMCGQRPDQNTVHPRQFFMFCPKYQRGDACLNLTVDRPSTTNLFTPRDKNASSRNCNTHGCGCLRRPDGNFSGPRRWHVFALLERQQRPTNWNRNAQPTRKRLLRASIL